MLLSKALHYFIEWGMSKYAPATVSNYSGLIQKFIDFTNNLAVEKTNITHITKFYAHLKQIGYAESSTAFTMVSLRQFFRYLYLRKMIDWDYQLIAIPKYVSKHYTPVESDEAENMINGIREKGFISIRNKTILSFLYSSGLRVAELTDLLVSDLDITQDYGVIISKKNRLRRMIFWNKQTGYLLKNKYLPERELWAGSDYLFVSLSRNNKGKKLSTRSIQRIVAEHRERKCITPHSFRHGLGMRCVKSQLHPRMIQKILGHKNLNSSAVYMEVADMDVVKAYQKVKG